MLRSFYPGRVVETRGGRYAVSAIPLEPLIPGFAATHYQFVRMDDTSRAVRLTLHERVAPADPSEHTRAA